MATIAPLKGIRYDVKKAGPLADLVTPPYDVINRHAEEAFLARNEHNIIRLDITKSQDSAEHKDEKRHVKAAAVFKSWLENGILIQENKAALYPYDIQYGGQGGVPKIRKGLICLVKLSEFSEGVIKPHEQTFDTVIEDRLELTRKCRAQFSQVFAVFPDRENKVCSLLETADAQSLVDFEDADGNRHFLRSVTDDRTISEVVSFFKDVQLYIADGHHRYTTALAYRNEILAEDEKMLDRPENYIMMYLSPMEDDGLSIFPTHRLIRYPGFISMDNFIKRVSADFEVREMTGGSRETLTSVLLEQMDENSTDPDNDQKTVLGVYHPREDRCCLLKMKSCAEDKLESVPSVLRSLDVVILSSLLVERALELERKACEETDMVSYHSDVGEAIDVSVKLATSQEHLTPLVFFMSATKIEQVREVSDEGKIMPHKSTYFYPKIITGLIINGFDHFPEKNADENIR